ncbi:MAG: gamma-glutamyl-gamma-aminobutyrate hydrolase family protein [Lachnospiraceae bacterium]|nr:gamma-glutamyl-gamma-aminobutyrate hydrolase family protein [Lachnospiraceae bacterium]
MAIHFILIVGRNKETVNYREAVLESGHIPIITNTLDLLIESKENHDALSPCLLSRIELLILPGGGDIAPDLLKRISPQTISDSTLFSNIDYELDCIQLAYLKYFHQKKLPIIGICKGMQLVNSYFGGTLLPDMTKSDKHLHTYLQYKDNQHSCQYISINNFPSFSNLTLLKQLYETGKLPTQINSAHHQCLATFGNDLIPFQYADYIPEGFLHATLPIIGLQWHPERLFYENGSYLKLLLSFFLT